MKNELNLDAGKLYILSAPPATGKSTFLNKNNIPEHMVLSADTIRSTYLGNTVGIDEQGEYNTPLYNDDSGVFSILKNILNMRMKEKLTTFLDITAVKDSVRKDFVKIALNHGVSTDILIFDVDKELCIEQDKKRKNRVGSEVINNFFENFQKESRFNHYLINSDTKIDIKPLSLGSSKFDIIGDTHGCFTEFLDFAQNQLGYKYENELLTHKKNRKMLFLGDFVDRGKESMEMLLLVKRMCNVGHKAIVGNHENKLINFYSALKDGRIHISSKSSSETAMNFVKLKKEKQTELYEWLKSLNHYYVQDEFAFTHAGVQHFDPINTPRSFCVYGSQRSKEDRKLVDNKFDELKNHGVNKYFLIRGHNALTDTEQTSVISLDNNVCFKNGTLNSLKLEDCIRAKRNNTNTNLQKLIKRHNVDFDFDLHKEKQFKLQNIMANLIKNQLASKKIDDTGFLSVFKYSKSVFYNQSWSENTGLLKCRGLVLDLAGNVAVHPFDKIFNYGEKNEQKEPTGRNISNEEEVIVVEKMNGFLGCVSKHPYKENQLLITTQGAFQKYQFEGKMFEGEYPNYIRELITKNMYSNFMRHLSKNNQTLMFEVIHPKDKENHIIKYSKEEEGLYLIGVRGNNPDDKVLRESEIDIIGEKIKCKRPKHFKTTLGEAKKLVEKSEIEGYMIRREVKDSNDNIDEEYICKFKTPNYLIIKFLSRMGGNKLNAMYNNPESFKQNVNVEEEFFPLIDYIVKNVDKEKFKALSEDERKVIIKQAIHYFRDDSLTNELNLLIEKNQLSKKSSINRKLK